MFVHQSVRTGMHEGLLQGQWLLEHSSSIAHSRHIDRCLWL